MPLGQKPGLAEPLYCVTCVRSESAATRSDAIIRTKAASSPSPAMLNGGTLRNRLLAWLVMEQTDRPSPVPVVWEQWTLPFNRQPLLLGWISIPHFCKHRDMYSDARYVGISVSPQGGVCDGTDCLATMRSHRSSSGDSIAVRLSV